MHKTHTPPATVHRLCQKKPSKGAEHQRQSKAAPEQGNAVLRELLNALQQATPGPNSAEAVMRRRRKSRRPKRASPGIHAMQISRSTVTINIQLGAQLEHEVCGNENLWSAE